MSHVTGLVVAAVIGLPLGIAACSETPRSGNPIFPGWYADPEAHVFDKQY